MRKFLSAIAFLAFLPHAWALDIAMCANLSQAETVKLANSANENFTKSIPNAVFLTDSIAFYLLLEADNTLQPCLIAKAADPANFINEASKDPLLSKFTYITQGALVIGTPTTRAFSDVEISQLQSALPTTKSPISARVWVSKVLKSLRADAEFAQKLEAPAVAPVVKQLEAIETIDLRLSDAGNNAVRAVIIASAVKDTPLAEFLSQRLPKDFPELYEKISIPSAAAFGYSLFNPAAVQKYQAHLKELFGSSYGANAITSTLPAELVSPSSGHVAFIFSKSLNLYQVLLGSWTPQSAGALLSAQAKTLSAEHTDEGATLAQNYNIAEFPVWTMTLGKEPVDYTLLYKGSLISAPTQEGLFEFFKTISADVAVPSSLGKAFTHYPTVTAQAIIKPRILAEGLMEAFPFGWPALPATLDNSPIYVAASIGSGKAAVTVDVPWGVIQAAKGFAEATQKHGETDPKTAEPQTTETAPEPKP